MVTKIISFIVISLLAQAAQNNKDLKSELDRVIPVKDVHPIIWGYLNCWSETHVLPNKSASKKANTSLVFSADGNYISSYRHPKLTIFNLKKQPQTQIEFDFSGYEIPLDRDVVCSFSPDGKYLLVASYRDYVAIFDVKTGRIYKTIRTMNCDEQISYISVSPDGLKYAFMYDNNINQTITKAVEIWDAQTLRYEQKLLSYRNLKPLIFSPDHKYIALTRECGWKLSFYVLKNFISVDKELCGNGYDAISCDITSAAWSPDGNRIAVSSEKDISLWAKNNNGHFVRQDGNKLLEWPIGSDEKRRIKYIAWSPDNKYLAIRSDSETDNTLYLLDWQKSIIVDQIPDVLFFVFSADGTQIATVGSDRAVKIWSNPVVTQEILNKNKSAGQSKSSCVIS